MDNHPEQLLNEVFLGNKKSAKGRTMSNKTKRYNYINEAITLQLEECFTQLLELKAEYKISQYKIFNRINELTAKQSEMTFLTNAHDFKKRIKKDAKN
jgi:hypothetical protein